MKYGKDGTVVLIEDHPLVRMVAKKSLEQSGIVVLDYPSCEEALDGLKESVLVAGFILDAELGQGRLNGADFQASLSSSNPEIPTVLFSGSVSSCENARNNGFKAVIKTSSVMAALKEILNE